MTREEFFKQRGMVAPEVKKPAEEPQDDVVFSPEEPEEPADELPTID